MIVVSCECTAAAQTKKDIKVMVVSGKGKDEILDFFAARYGERTRVAPRKRGFSIMPWMFPFL